MADFNMSRNAEGYYDETPYKAVLQNMVYARAWEIWASTQGKEFLVLKNHGKVCNVLSLNDVWRMDNMEVMSRKAMYTNPVMVGYMFTDNLVEFIKTMPEDAFAQIVHAVAEKLELNVVYTPEATVLQYMPEEVETQVEELKRALQDAEERADNQKKELESLYRAIEAKTVQAEDLSTRLGLVEEEKEDFLALCEKKDKELAEASVYKDEYHALLDSLLHGGKMQ